MKRIHTLLLVLFCCVTCVSAGVYTPETVPNVQLQDSTRLVSNPDGVISAQAEAKLNIMLRDIRSVTTAEPVVVMIDDMAPDYDIDSFATDLFGKWGIGKSDKDNGLLILVVKNAKKYCIRTGYGVEGMLPDALAGRIQRQYMRPAFREGDFDTGMINAVAKIQEIMTDPNVRDELLSNEESEKNDLTLADFLEMYLIFSVVLTLVLLLYLVYKVNTTKGMDRHDRYLAMRSILPISKYMSFLCLAFPLIVYFPAKAMLEKWRNGVHKCPNCGTRMNKLDEETDNKYLTPAQDTEERLNSVDYDVWLCPNCGETDIYAYRNPTSTLTECPQCHAHAVRMVRDRILRQPSQSHNGQGVKEYQCLNCNHTFGVPYTIAKTAAPPVIIIPGGRGGGFGGGGFGGGMTGGGGASGGW